MSNINNIKPYIWGPPAWDFLYYIVLAYPNKPTQEDKNNISVFFNSLGPILPCDKCRNNYKSHLNTLPLSNNVLANRTNLIHWLIDIQNSVSKMNNSPKKMTYGMVMKKYMYTDNNNIITYCIIIAIIVLVLFVKIRGF